MPPLGHITRFKARRGAGGLINYIILVLGEFVNIFIESILQLHKTKKNRAGAKALPCLPLMENQIKDYRRS